MAQVSSSSVEATRAVQDAVLAATGQLVSRLTPDLSTLSQQEAGGVVRTVASGTVQAMTPVATTAGNSAYLDMRDRWMAEALARSNDQAWVAEQNAWRLEQASLAAEINKAYAAKDAAIQAAVGRSMKNYSQGMFVEAGSVLADSMMKLMGDTFRDTIKFNSQRDKNSQGFQRVASQGACAFCLMVSLNKYTTFDEDGGYHDNCHCVTIPIFKGESAYTPDYYKDFKDIYAKGRADASSSKATDILAAIRSATGRN